MTTSRTSSCLRARHLSGYPLALLTQPSKVVQLEGHSPKQEEDTHKAKEEEEEALTVKAGGTVLRLLKVATFGRLKALLACLHNPPPDYPPDLQYKPRPSTPLNPARLGHLDHHRRCPTASSSLQSPNFETLGRNPPLSSQLRFVRSSKKRKPG